MFSATTVVLLLNSLTAEDARHNPVSRKIVEARLRKYGGDNRQREATLKRMFADAGCGTQNLSEQSVEGSKLPNVTCRLSGSSGRVIIVGAHFDRVSGSDGVVDNWTGASLLPSLYESLKIHKHKHTYIFIGFTDEEHGELGSRFYASQMTKEQVDATDAMVNMDTLGLGPPRVWAGHSDEQLTAVLVRTAKQLKVLVANVGVERVTTDAEQFFTRGIPRITIHSLTQETSNAHIIHTSMDKLSILRFDDYYQTYRLLAAYLAALD